MAKVEDIDHLIEELEKYSAKKIAEFQQRAEFLQSSFSFASVLSSAQSEARSAVESLAQDVVADLLED